jgi:hypothetical protein
MRNIQGEGELREFLAGILVQALVQLARHLRERQKQKDTKDKSEQK